jgi:hypothetical protein
MLGEVVSYLHNKVKCDHATCGVQVDLYLLKKLKSYILTALVYTYLLQSPLVYASLPLILLLIPQSLKIVPLLSY